MSNALTLHDMSPGLRKVVGRRSPRATLAEGAGCRKSACPELARGRVGQPLGLLYKVFSTDCARLSLSQPCTTGSYPPVTPAPPRTLIKCLGGGS